MSQLVTRSVRSRAGQQTYRVPGQPDVAPATVTVNGSAATFTSTLSVDDVVRTITITTPTIAVDGQEIVMTFTPSQDYDLPPMAVQARPVRSAGGFKPGNIHRLVSAAASVNATLIRAGSGRLYRIRGYNNAAAVRFLKVYDKATAPSQTDTPILTLTLKAAEVFDFDLYDCGLDYSAGLGYRITGTAPDADTTALAAGDVTGMAVFFT